MTHLISDQYLSELNQQGLIPGPDESEEQFLQRAQFCLDIVEHLSNHTGETFEPTDCSFLSEALPTTKELYDIAPEWPPILFDSHKLSFWHGGCAWIFQLNDTSPISAILQLQKKLKHSPSLYGFFNRKEIIIHEISHIGRMAFDEPQFEEILAYRSSQSSLRSKLGAIAQNSKESGLFVLSLITISMLDLFLVFSGYESLYNKFIWLKLIPLGMITYGLARLAKNQKTLDTCISTLAKTVINPSHSLAVAYRLTDDEIKKFATYTPNKVLAYAKENEKLSLRWRLICSKYL
ncbi:MAG: hypothetical protein VX777_08985 [Chlamydiota bacterium]|nr:hypothetical protein [Chlamydiota bacterium]